MVCRHRGRSVGIVGVGGTHAAMPWERDHVGVQPRRDRPRRSIPSNSRSGILSPPVVTRAREHGVPPFLGNHCLEPGTAKRRRAAGDPYAQWHTGSGWPMRRFALVHVTAL